MFIRSTQISFSCSITNIPARSFRSLTPCAPYKTKEIFVRETQGAFRPVTHQKLSSYYSPYQGTAEDIKEMSWSIYNRSIQAAVKAPALIYTGADYNLVHPFKYKLVNAGRLYAPTYHIWSANATWILSQIHKRREIISISDPIYTVSGFTRELVCAFRAGYTLTNITFIDGGRTIVHLAPPSYEQALNFTLFNLLTITEKDCIAAQTKFNQEKKELLNRNPGSARYDLIQFLNRGINREDKRKLSPVSITNGNHSLFKQNHIHKKHPAAVDDSEEAKSLCPHK